MTVESHAPLSPRSRAVIIIAAAVAFAAKLLLALRTYGTNDVYTYEHFALWARYFGAELYRIDPDLNHPPSMLHFLGFLLRMSEHTPLPFQFWLRFPGILADVGSLWLVCQIVGSRISERSVFIAVLLIAIAPTNILIAGFHGNTDPVMIFFVIAAVWLAGYRGNAPVGGIAFGLAICVKVAPLILVPVLFLSLPGVRKRIEFFAATVTVVLIAWWPYFFQEPSAILHQVFGYKSSYGLWGFSWLFRALANAWPASGWLNRAFSHAGSPIVMAAVLALSVGMSRLAKRPSLYAQVGMVFLLFFTFTSGFAVQYLVWLTPWLAELDALAVALFVITGSMFLLVVYNYWNLGFPWHFAIAYPWSSHQYFQALCWISVCILAGVAWNRIRYHGEFGIDVLPGIPSLLRFGVAALSACAFLFYPAIVHMRRDKFGVSPAYAEDTVLYTRADGYHQLATQLLQKGRTSEAFAAENQASLLNARAKDSELALVRLQPVRPNLRTPEDYVEASRAEYDRGEFEQCAFDATESLKYRPGMPAALNNIELCDAELGNWDAAVAAATEALRIEPESDDIRANLAWVTREKRRAAGPSK